MAGVGHREERRPHIRTDNGGDDDGHCADDHRSADAGADDGRADDGGAHDDSGIADDHSADDHRRSNSCANDGRADDDRRANSSSHDNPPGNVDSERAGVGPLQSPQRLAHGGIHVPGGHGVRSESSAAQVRLPVEGCRVLALPRHGRQWLLLPLLPERRLAVGSCGRAGHIGECREHRGWKQHSVGDARAVEAVRRALCEHVEQQLRGDGCRVRLQCGELLQALLDADVPQYRRSGDMVLPGRSLGGAEGDQCCRQGAGDRTHRGGVESRREPAAAAFLARRAARREVAQVSELALADP
mmetsp:Transcript_112919/g.326189  ORF Transcript_112919/g.326189 Transcript_112919/m.326189 type:complete len:300 (+) Transcript_112919:536-1435(+)